MYMHHLWNNNSNDNDTSKLAVKLFPFLLFQDTLVSTGAVIGGSAGVLKISLAVVSLSIGSSMKYQRVTHQEQCSKQPN